MVATGVRGLNRKQRKELTRRLRAQDPGLDIVHPHAAGIDVGNSSHYVAVRPDRVPDPVRRFECFTADLHRLTDWLRQCGVTTVAMQSTGVYWIALYEILDARGLDVYLVNARHTKNLPGRKTDVQESQWLLKLHTYGLLRNSFHPSAAIRVVRTYWRQLGDHVQAVRPQHVLREDRQPGHDGRAEQPEPRHRQHGPEEPRLPDHVPQNVEGVVKQTRTRRLSTQRRGRRRNEARRVC